MALPFSVGPHRQFFCVLLRLHGFLDVCGVCLCVVFGLRWAVVVMCCQPLRQENAAVIEPFGATTLHSIAQHLLDETHHWFVLLAGGERLAS